MQQKVNAIIDFPLRGEWLSLRPPGHHPYALDFMKVGKHRRHVSRRTLSGYLLSIIPAKNFFGWEEPIFSPYNGVVIRASDGWADRKVTSIVNTILIWLNATFLFRPKIDDSGIDIRPNAGNYVMIRSAIGQVAFIAHMRCGSVKVTTGQVITAGQIIGLVGNSGNTTAPHLHINLFDQADDLLQSKLVEFIFRRFDRWNGKSWEMVENSIPIKGELIRSHADNGQSIYPF